MRVLAVNAGSSSLKLSLIDGGETLSRASVATDELAGHVDGLGRIDAVGHRVVHGGRRFREPTVVTREVEAALHELAALAPLHQEKSLLALGEVRRLVDDGVPEVACFDTAFHAEIPETAATYALPAAWRQRWDLRRFGFHGLAHAWAAREAGRRLGAVPARMVSCHLGAGASLCAIRDGHSVDTTMGFTPLEGLVMATRSGSVDPGLLLWLLERAGVGTHEMARALEHDSGLLALAGTPDMAAVVAASEAGDARARLAFGVYVHHVRAGIGAMAAALGGVDVLTFSGGVGERSAAVRDAVTAGLGFLGEPEVLVVEAREDLEIARGVEDLLGG